MGFDPFSLAMMVGGTIAGVGGSLVKGGQEAALNKYKAAWSQQQAAVEKQNAEYARSVGEIRAQQVGLRAAKERGEAVVGLASHGFRRGMGTGEDVISAIRQKGQYDEYLTRANAAREAYGHEVKAAEDTAKANMYSSAAKTSKIASYFDAATILGKNASQVAEKWTTYSEKGLLTDTKGS